MGQEKLKLYITNYYKHLFGAPDDSFVSLDESRVDDIPKLVTDENEILTAQFLEKEVFEAISQMRIIKLLDRMDFRLSFIKKVLAYY